MCVAVAAASRRGSHRAIAAAEALSLSACLARLSETLLTPPERAERAGDGPGRAERVERLRPTAAEEQDLDRVLDRRLARVSDQ
ncbi:hypothetical protein OOZ58_27870 [Streptomyces tauricus]|nr:hypothetical protein [Streptomyces tauricus]